MKQRDFFAILEPKQTADVIGFPATRLRGLVDETVGYMLRDDRKAEWHRRHGCGRVWSYLTIARIDRAEIERQVAAFSAALDAELTRRAVLDRLAGRVGDGGGAA